LAGGRPPARGRAAPAGPAPRPPPPPPGGGGGAGGGEEGGGGGGAGEGAAALPVHARAGPGALCTVTARVGGGAGEWVG